jgi:uncharacterized membrane protein (UPF0127 family)
MHFVEINNVTRPNSSLIRAGVCDSFYLKLRGLMFSPSISTDEGLLFIEKEDSKINSTIHMFFMRFDIAVVWLNPNLEVIDTVLARKWRPYYAPAQPASYILETHLSNLERFQIGDKISLKNV